MASAVDVKNVGLQLSLFFFPSLLSYFYHPLALFGDVLVMQQVMLHRMAKKFSTTNLLVKLYSCPS